MPEFVTNDYDLRCAREELALEWGSSLDAKRPRAWQQYGYPETVGFDQLRQAYERNGPGHGAVHRLLDRCWLKRPRIKQPDADAQTPWEKDVCKLLRPLWRRLLDFDRRNMVGRFSGLIYRVADGKGLDQPLGKAGKLVDLVPVFEDQLRVVKWDEDTGSPTFGKPTMWQYRMRAPHLTGATQAAPDKWQDVHPSRIQIMAEGSAGGEFFEGVPLLLAGFNHLADLEKIGGGSAESFLKNSARTIVVKFDANSNPAAITQNPDGTASGKTIGQAVEEKVAKLNRSIDASIVTAGGDATTLQTTVSDPTGAWMLAANLFAASVRYPFTVIFGQQTGRLASDQDRSDADERCQSRQQNELTPVLEELIERLQACGVIAEGDFEIEWPPLDAPGDGQKAELLAKMTAAMKDAAAAGVVEPLFDPDELRGVMDYEERHDPATQGGDPALAVDPLTGQPIAGAPGTPAGAAPATTLPAKKPLRVAA